jgi:hypothetical protein
MHFEAKKCCTLLTQMYSKLPDLRISEGILTLSRSYLKPYCMGRKTVFFSAGI